MHVMQAELLAARQALESAPQGATAAAAAAEELAVRDNEIRCVG